MILLRPVAPQPNESRTGNSWYLLGIDDCEILLRDLTHMRAGGLKIKQTATTTTTTTRGGTQPSIFSPGLIRCTTYYAVVGTHKVASFATYIQYARPYCNVIRYLEPGGFSQPKHSGYTSGIGTNRLGFRPVPLLRTRHRPTSIFAECQVHVTVQLVAAVLQ